MRYPLLALCAACLGALLLGCGKIDDRAPAAKPAAAKPAAAKLEAPSAKAVASEVNDFADYATGSAALSIKKRQEEALGKIAKQQKARSGGQ